MRIEWSVQALQDLDEMLAAFVASINPHGDALLAERVARTDQTILISPRAGRYDSETDTYDVFVPKTRFILTYAMRENVIWIVTAWHTSRDPDTKPKRESGSKPPLTASPDTSQQNPYRA